MGKRWNKIKDIMGLDIPIPCYIMVLILVLILTLNFTTIFVIPGERDDYYEYGLWMGTNSALNALEFARSYPDYCGPYFPEQQTGNERYDNFMIELYNLPRRPPNASP